MPKQSRISPAQLTTLLLASRLSGCFLLTHNGIGRMNITDRLLSTVLSGVLLWLLCLPTLWICRRTGGTLNGAYQCSRRFGRFTGGGYLFLCVFLLSIDVLQFHDFAEKVMNSDFSVPLLTVSLVIVSFLASLYGVSALARASLLVAAFSLICLVVFGISLLPEMRVWYFPPVENSGFFAIVRTAVTDLPRTAEITVLGLLYPYVNGKADKAVPAFVGATTVVTAGITATAVGVLGDFALHTAYPYYTAAAAAQIGVFERIDILIVAVWLATFFVRMTLFAGLFTSTARRLLKKGVRWAVPLGACLPLLLALVTPSLTKTALVTGVYWGVLLRFCVGVPLVLFIRKGRCKA